MCNVTCPICNKDKPQTDFQLKIMFIDGKYIEHYHEVCTACTNLYMPPIAKYVPKLKPLEEVLAATTKVCSKCGIEKNKSEFYKNRVERDGYRCDCKACHNVVRNRGRAAGREVRQAYVAQLKIKREEAKAIAPVDIPIDGSKRTCTTCKVEKWTTEFPPTYVRQTGYKQVSAQCKSCKNAYVKMLNANRTRKQYSHNPVITRVIEVSHPHLYKPEDITTIYHIFCACTKLSDAKTVANRLKDSNVPYVMGVWYGDPDDDKDYGHMQRRCITVFTSPTSQAEYDLAYCSVAPAGDAHCIWDIWGKDKVL